MFTSDQAALTCPYIAFFHTNLYMTDLFWITIITVVLTNVGQIN